MDSSEMSKMYIDEYISRARKAQAEFEKMSQEDECLPGPIYL